MTVMKTILAIAATAVVGACAVDGLRDAPDDARFAMGQGAQPSGLPAWHPPVEGRAMRLPQGHPPIGGQLPVLPEGHPPIPGASDALPEGHPACPAMSGGWRQGPKDGRELRAPYEAVRI